MNMTVIAWDGNILAADRRMSAANTHTSILKIHSHGKHAMAISGYVSHGLAILDWFKKGAKPSDWPQPFNKDEWGNLIVVSEGRCYLYEDHGVPIEILSEFAAWGCGREFAIGAMAAGMNAIDAVKITNTHCNNCGNGVDHIDTRSLI